MCETAGMIANLDRCTPVIADADTGFGGSLMVHRTVLQYIRAGVAALHLEDQVLAKRCGHLRNKQLVPEPEFLSRIKAASIKRLKSAVELGADVAFLEGVRSKEEARRVCQDLHPVPVLFNAVAGGLSPDLSIEEAQKLGFRLIIFPGFALGPTIAALTTAAKHLKETGSLEVTGELSPQALFTVVGLHEALAIDAASGAGLFQDGV
ncbi:hypothetical protein N7470_002577 [Penicillium chermesinum]|nr:hypothetical protein N7470_002577 [Penicillium chermesinum]